MGRTYRAYFGVAAHASVTGTRSTDSFIRDVRSCRLYGWVTESSTYDRARSSSNACDHRRRRSDCERLHRSDLRASITSDSVRRETSSSTSSRIDRATKPSDPVPFAVRVDLLNGSPYRQPISTRLDCWSLAG